MVLLKLFFEEHCPVPGKKTCNVTAERYLALLRDHVVPALPERRALPVVTVMQDGSPPHIACDVKAFLLESFPKDRVIVAVVRFISP